MDLEMGVCRWAVNIAPWLTSSKHFNQLMSLLPSSEQSAVLSYFKMEDRKRALVSRLLQRILVHTFLNIPYHDILIARTPEGKPYLANLLRAQEFANFNFNVSHHGSYVVIASDPEYLVGVDVMACDSAQTEYPLEYIDNFRSYFTKLELQTICSSGLDDVEKYHQFYRSNIHMLFSMILCALSNLILGTEGKRKLLLSEVCLRTIIILCF
ncbi:hypothetical protein O6H91_23G066300 [Diphasiastrum complanatum]|uniref:Uncharacterized protein n=1 Tax=Diphasiastrum complanatum TaxID=34168 RepID=A0ACC2ABJ5_DIPCM|nr:hypothetical protein O6H91_23G066300 [Diphasiastrum complanatum]